MNVWFELLSVSAIQGPKPLMGSALLLELEDLPRFFLRLAAILYCVIKGDLLEVDLEAGFSPTRDWWTQERSLEDLP